MGTQRSTKMDYIKMLELLSTQELFFPISTIADFSGSAMSWLEQMTPILASEPSTVQQWATRLYQYMLVALGLGLPHGGPDHIAALRR